MNQSSRGSLPEKNNPTASRSGMLLFLLIAQTASIPNAVFPAVRSPVVDSAMSIAQAFDGINPKCPAEIRDRQTLVEVLYYSMDHQIHRGQVVIDRELALDIKKAFKFALKNRFPIYSVVPISDPRFRKDGLWDDELSMESDNTSAFNYRPATGSSQLSNHAYGRAIDINPFLNPYMKNTVILPTSAKYDPSVPGTFTGDSPVVRRFKSLGWTWGGEWTSLKDYQHFEKPRQSPALQPLLLPGDSAIWIGLLGD